MPAAQSIPQRKEAAQKPAHKKAPNKKRTPKRFCRAGSSNPNRGEPVRTTDPPALRPPIDSQPRHQSAKQSDQATIPVGSPNPSPKQYPYRNRPHAPRQKSRFETGRNQRQSDTSRHASVTRELKKSRHIQRPDFSRFIQECYIEVNRLVEGWTPSKPSNKGTCSLAASVSAVGKDWYPQYY